MPVDNQTGIIEKIRQMAGSSVGTNRVSMTQKLRMQYGKENEAGQTGNGEETGDWSEWLVKKGYSLGKDGLVQSAEAS